MPGEPLSSNPNNVIAVPERPKESLGWVCGCGGTLWTLFANGHCVCSGCNCISTVIRVVKAEETA